jgi:hypothetical protein
VTTDNFGLPSLMSMAYVVVLSRIEMQRHMRAAEDGETGLVMRDQGINVGEVTSVVAIDFFQQPAGTFEKCRALSVGMQQIGKKSL